MKKINIIMVVLAMAIFTVSCETYDDYNTDRKTVVGFTDKSKNINNIPEGGSRSVNVDIFASDISSVDRTFNIIAITPVETPVTASENYSFDSTVVIPANTREGVISVTGIDNSIEGEEYFGLAIEGGGDVVSGGFISIRVRN